MNILFDLISTQPKQNMRFHGGGEFTKKIFIELTKDRKNNNIFGLYDKNRFFDESLYQYAKINGIDLIGVSNLNEINNILKIKKIDRIFVGMPEKIYEEINYDNIDLIYCLHDTRRVGMRYQKFLWHYEKNYTRKIGARYLWPIFNYIRKKKTNKYRNNVMQLLKKANTIITVSNYSKYAIMQHCFKLNIEKKIKVCYSPEKIVRENTSNNYNKLEINNPYFLLISCNRYEKNSYLAVAAFDELFTNYEKIKNMRVVCCGNLPKSIKKKIKNENNFVFLDYVDSEQLESLYKNSFAFVYPTLYEGFGYPPLEAMKYGTPVICSAITSVPEVCGDAGIYFNPYSKEELINAILYSLNNDLTIYREKSLVRYKIMRKRQAESLKRIVAIILR